MDEAGSYKSCWTGSVIQRMEGNPANRGDHMTRMLALDED